MIRIALISLVALTLTACGFKPMHSTASNAAFDNVEVITQPGKDLGDEQTAFYVQQRLRDRIGNSPSATQVLMIDISAQRGAIGISDQDVATRYDTNLVASYILRDKKTGDILYEGKAQSVTTFGAPFDPYGVVQADTNSKQQAARELADRLLNQLAAHYASAGPS